jgi:hypothetical protein
MSGIAIKILVGLGMKLLTETFVARVLVHTARQVAKSTANTLDDKLVDDLAAGLGVSDKP